MSNNIFRWYRAGLGRYTQADLLGLAAGPNLYGYVRSNPTIAIDPLGLVEVRQHFNQGRSNTGRYYEPWNTWYAWGECDCVDGSYRMKLILDYTHNFICDGTVGNCNIENWHATIASAWVTSNAKKWNFAEQLEFDTEDACYDSAKIHASELMKRANEWMYDPKYRQAQQ